MLDVAAARFCSSSLVVLVAVTADVSINAAVARICGTKIIVQLSLDYAITSRTFLLSSSPQNSTSSTVPDICQGEIHVCACIGPERHCYDRFLELRGIPLDGWAYI